MKLHDSTPNQTEQASAIELFNVKFDEMNFGRASAAELWEVVKVAPSFSDAVDCMQRWWRGQVFRKIQLSRPVEDEARPWLLWVQSAPPWFVDDAAFALMVSAAPDEWKDWLKSIREQGRPTT